MKSDFSKSDKHLIIDVVYRLTTLDPIKYSLSLETVTYQQPKNIIERICFECFTFDKDAICKDAINLLKCLDLDLDICIESKGFTNKNLEKETINELRYCFQKHILYNQHKD